VYFYKGNKNILAELKGNETELQTVKNEILQVFDVKNLSFLLGAGCSSYYLEDADIGIPIMSNMAKEFYSLIINDTDKKFITNNLKIDIDEEPFKYNLEKLLEVLYSYRFLLESQGASVGNVEKFISKVTAYLLKKCINKSNNDKHKNVVELYSLFYKKLIYRDNNLSKTNIFTTNYDLYSETALDKLGILYTNGFSGLTERYFNPTVFNYAYAEQMELSNNKWNVIDNFIYLYKLHGSINWVESDDQNHLFKVEELQKVTGTENNVMIYPTPMKQVASFASPYSDLFREFQKKLMQDKNVLIVIGYSFSDEHINNLIYQALTIPNFRLVIFQNEAEANIKRLIDLNDPRIWVIGGEEESKKTYYFDYIVNDLLPDIDQEKIEESIDKVVKNLLKKQQP
jgi:hypothetical protein